jgi:hypothetical protein
MRNAVIDGDYDKVRQLLDQGADVNSTNEYHIGALCWAADGHEASHVRIAQLLIDRGAKTEIRCGGNLDGTPLQVARSRGYRGVASVLERSTGEVGLFGNPRFETSTVAAKVGLPFKESATADCRGGDWTASLSVKTGALPPGIRLRSNGDIDGVPIRAGDWYFTIEFSSVECAGKRYANVTQQMNIKTEGSAAPAVAR